MGIHNPEPRFQRPHGLPVRRIAGLDGRGQGDSVARSTRVSVETVPMGREKTEVSSNM